LITSARGESRKIKVLNQVLKQHNPLEAQAFIIKVFETLMSGYLRVTNVYAREYLFHLFLEVQLSSFLVNVNMSSQSSQLS
jgi:hypothetical protein